MTLDERSNVYLTFGTYHGKNVCVILKLDLNALDYHFLSVIHGPQNCMK